MPSAGRGERKVVEGFGQVASNRLALEMSTALRFSDERLPRVTAVVRRRFVVT